MGDRLSDAIAGVITNVPVGDVPVLAIVTSVLSLFHQANVSEKDQSAVRSETLLQSSSSWDGEPYKSYPSGQPKLLILKITLPPHTKLEWHSHSMPSAAYIIAGQLTLERKKDGMTRHFTAGQALSETVDTPHRGVTGDEPVVLIVFYAGIPDEPVSQHSTPVRWLVAGRRNRRRISSPNEG